MCELGHVSNAGARAEHLALPLHDVITVQVVRVFTCKASMARTNDVVTDGVYAQFQG